MPAVSLEHISCRFGEVLAVDDVNLDVEQGDFVTLLGPSGCGKTTTLRMVAGLEQNSGGRISIGNRVVSDAEGNFFMPPDRRRLGMVFQSYAIWPHMTVFDNVAYPLRVRRKSKDEIKDRVTAALRLVEMSKYADRPAPALSGGQQQRVAIARALVFEPEVLLLDEPLSNLDANLREEMRFEVRRLHDTCGITSIYVTHDQSEAMATADLICVMRAGRIEQVGAPEEIYERPRSEFVARFIGASNVIRARTLDRSHVEIGGARLRINGDTTSGETAIAIRQHDMALTTAPPPQSDNVVAATVVRQAFVGAHRDYMVEIAGGARLRVLAPAEVSIETGRAVFLHLPPERCRALAS